MLGADERMGEWEADLANFGWAGVTGRRVRIIRDQKFEDFGRNISVPDPRDVKRLVNDRLRLLYQQDLGDLPPPRPPSAG